MKTAIIQVKVALIALTLLFSGCDQKPSMTKEAPVKEGVIYKVVWSEKGPFHNGLFRDKQDTHQNVQTFDMGLTGEYGIDMYGALYPGFVEVRLIGGKDTYSLNGSKHASSLIIPVSQIVSLEFGTGGIAFQKQ